MHETSHVIISLNSLGPNLSFEQLTDISGISRTSKDIHIVVGLILAFLRRARPRADFYKRRLKDSKEESFSNQKEGGVFCVGSSWEPGDWNGELLLWLVKEVFYLLRNSLRRMVAAESLIWSFKSKGGLRGEKEERLCSGSWSKRIWCHSMATVQWKTALFGEETFLSAYVFLQPWVFFGAFLGYVLCLVIIPLMALLISLRYGQADKFEVAYQLLSAKHRAHKKMQTRKLTSVIQQRAYVVCMTCWQRLIPASLFLSGSQISKLTNL